MNFPDEYKKDFLKATTEILKSYRGKGSESHYVKYYESEIHVYIEGLLSHTEKYLFQKYGQDYMDAVYRFYEDTAKNETINRLNQYFDNKFQFNLISWEPDLLNDKCLFKYSFMLVT